MAVSGHNGNNETFIGMSESIGLTFYDHNLNELEINRLKSSESIDIVMKRDPNLPEYQFQSVNISQLQLSSAWLYNGFNLTSNNASIHIELKPFNRSIAYLILLKLGYSPVINSSYVDYTSFKIFCPSK